MKQTNKADSRLASAEQLLRDAASAASAGGADGTPSRDDDDRRVGSVVDRRMGVDRRDMGAFVERRAARDGNGETESAGDCHTNLERRRGPGRRRTDFMKSADEGEMSQEQFLFIMAIDAFKRVNGKTFPTWTDVLEVIRKLGYRKTQPSELKNLGANTEDWTERADAPAGVFKQAVEDE